MSEQKLRVCIVLTIVAGLWSPAWSDTSPSTGETAKTWTFDSEKALTGWMIDGNVSIDTSKARQGIGGTLKIGPGGKALLTLRDKDESGRVEVWIYDDNTVPETSRPVEVGPRWGLVQSDGNVLAVGTLLRQLSWRRRRLHGQRLRRQILVRSTVLAGRSPRRRPVGTSGPSTSIARWGCKCCTTTRRSRRSTPENGLEGLPRLRGLGRRWQGPRADDLAG